MEGTVLKLSVEVMAAAAEVKRDLDEAVCWLIRRLGPE